MTYIERINLVLDHIQTHLDQSLSLLALAELADLSPFHFHRIFQAVIGETPHDFIKRLRLERAVSLMSFGQAKSLTTIAMECGFASSSDFSRSFKQRYGLAPSKFDLAAWQAERAERTQSIGTEVPFRLQRLQARANPDKFRVRIRELSARNVAYIRVSNPYSGDRVIQAGKRILAWADSRKLADNPWIGYQFENPTITGLESCYYCLAVEVEDGIQAQGEIGIYRFPAMTVAEVEMKGDIDLEIRLLQWLYGSWLPRSRYMPADQPCFEAWLGRPFATGLNYFELKIQLPIKRCLSPRESPNDYSGTRKAKT